MYSVIAPMEPLPLMGGGSLALPLAGVKVHAGFPSPADDYLCKRIDLNEILVTHPQATFMFRVAGDSMRDEGIDDGDLLVVSRASSRARACCCSRLATKIPVMAVPATTTIAAISAAK